MAEGRTTYWSKDAAWWRRERIEILGAEFGPAGPAVIDWLSCEADSQRDGGRVKTGPHAVSKGCFLGDAQLAERIVRRAVELGALDDLESHGLAFTVRMSGWTKDQKRAAAAARKRSSRERADGPLSRLVTLGHAGSRAVHDGETECAETAERTLAAVEADEPSPDAQNDGETVNTDDSGALSRPVTHRHAESRSVTESHVKTRPVNSNNTPPQPPASGGRERDQARRENDYDTTLNGYLTDHPCSTEDTTIDRWHQLLVELPDDHALWPWLDQAHPHENDGALLIGVHRASSTHLAKFAQHAFTEPVLFVECPSIAARSVA